MQGQAAGVSITAVIPVVAQPVSDLTASMIRAAAVAIAISGSAFAASVTVTAPPSGDCAIHLIEHGTETTAPCNAGIQTAGGSAVAWVETSSSITPFMTDVTGGGSLDVRDLVPRGVVTFPHDRELGAGERIHLVSFVSPNAGDRARPLFRRDVATTTDVASLPAGKAVALLIDRRGRALAMSRPFTVAAGAQTEVWPEQAKRSQNAVAIALDYPTWFARKDAVAVTIADGGGSRAPTMAVDGADALFAVWYDLAGPTGRIVVDSRDLRVAHDRVDLTAGSVSLVEETLRTLPSLTVSIAALPRSVREVPELSLELATAANGSTALRTIAVAPDKRFVLEHVPAELLLVDLHIGEFVLQRQLDLSAGDDATLEIALEPLSISGTVYRGDSPARARLRFLQKGEPLVVETDDFGRYEITIWQPRRYIVETVLTDRPTGPAFTQDVAVARSMTLDVHVPDNVLVARVFDAADGKPIEHAEIVVRNRWSDGGGESSSVMTVPATGELTELPPQRAGTTEIQAHAAGYSSAAPQIVNIDAPVGRRVISLPLRKGEDGRALQIRIGSAPAARAEVATFSGDRLLWRGVADDSGEVELPRSLEAVRLVVRHPDAASMVVMAPGKSITLASAATPLTIRVLRRDHDAVGPAGATISLWLRGGIRLTGAEAGFATWSLGATSPEGTVTLRGLLPASLRILATRRQSAEQARRGAFDRLAETIPHPWPPLATLTLADE
jgi:hypothetical protein